MHILVVSVNYRTAPVEFREKLTFQAAELERAMTTLQNQKSVLENVIVSTCNRTEIYAVVDQLHTGRYYIKKFLADWFQLEIEEVAPYLTIFEQDGAIDHLFRVTCGLDSMIVGETQILGQIKDSFLEAQQVKATGTIFNELFKQVITLAKRAHSETTIGESAMSVSYAAVELGKKIFGELTDCHVLILGAGKMGELALQNLYGSGARKVTVMNRTLSKAEVMAEKYMGHAKSLSELQCALLEADILISSTGASEYVITKEMMTKVEKMRSGRPLFMVDIAVPRDIDPAIDELEGSFLYDIDDLQGVVEANRAERLKEAEKIQFMIEEEIVLFKTWLSTLGVVPLISALRDKALAIQSETMVSLERKIPNLSDREKKVISKHTKSIINQLLKDPILVAKEIAAEEGASEKLALFAKIFDLETEEVESRAEEVEHKRVWTPSVPSL
ncbi:glutamyl-tRNA reductase [Bacillus thuringiensis]|uniref:Glutamyl-tRNA reductase n=2 Tax=Bacillus thuringiensis TaxID=1428 RepID=A0ABD5I5Z9_BACTU|nr:glutamyl-tRNA reductase [Bacillus thuringiensis]EEM94198.1 Glutamyl-tRNA reductase [Bacillus thuringiensis IBL 200]MCR6782494.1 glutamyl-tRNA reductase [Bacillus thuringiensis]MCR6860564.1 glutamyl-tRNA reductase [Bacillus thuringiensis]MCR6864216.1 glutamyl-tRNA reductase [Bacillus thuringiensis]MDW9212610.1 glutamyl-tRNA reductase [Bacillus thuringiensis serovar toumanoffi]